MLKLAEPKENNSELIPVGALASKSAVSVPAANQNEMQRRASHPSPASSSSVSVLGNRKTRQKEVGFQVLAGSAQRLLPSLEAGAVGAVLAFASPAPTACYEIYAAWKEGDAELARLKQDRITAAATRVGSELGVPALKYAADLNGYYGGPARLPLLPLTAEQKAEVERLMADIRN
jgi:dihydrodipicolinate synthase/N-acetylneuraminate lyase